MTRTEMVKARTQKLSALTDMQLVDTIVKYFEQNATLPGQKAIKDYAISLKQEFDGNVITGLLSQVRNDLIEEFASLCVQEVKLTKVLAANETKRRLKEGGILPLASDLPMTLTDITPIPVNTVKNTYSMTVLIDKESKVVEISESSEMGGQAFASLPKGFRKNHPEIGGLKGTVLAADYSNGKFANMSYTMLIDLGESCMIAA